MSTKILKITAVLILTVIATTLFAGVVFADTNYDYTPLAPLPGTYNTVTGKVPVSSDSNALVNYINGLYKLAVASASVLAVLMIVVGGFNYVSTDAISGKEAGKDMIKSAVGGLLLVFASWIILNTINPQLVSLEILSKKLTPNTLKSLFSFYSSVQNEFKKIADATSIKATRDEADKMGKTARAMKDTLSQYNDMEKLLGLQKKASLTEEEVYEMAGLQNIYGMISDADVATMKGIVDDYGGKEMLEKEAENLRVRADITAVTADSMSFIKNTLDGLIAFGKTSKENYLLAADSIANQYKKVMVEIDNSVKSGALTTEQATDLKDQLRPFAFEALNTICSKITSEPDAAICLRIIAK